MVFYRYYTCTATQARNWGDLSSNLMNLLRTIWRPFLFSAKRNLLCVPLILLMNLDLRSQASVLLWRTFVKRTISLSLQKDIFILPNPDRRLQIWFMSDMNFYPPGWSVWVLIRKLQPPMHAVSSMSSVQRALPLSRSISLLVNKLYALRFCIAFSYNYRSSLTAVRSNHKDLYSR